MGRSDGVASQRVHVTQFAPHAIPIAPIAAARVAESVKPLHNCTCRRPRKRRFSSASDYSCKLDLLSDPVPL